MGAQSRMECKVEGRARLKGSRVEGRENLKEEQSRRVKHIHLFPPFSLSQVGRQLMHDVRVETSD